MALSISTNVALPTNIPGVLRKATTNPIVDNVFVYADGVDKWERVFDSGDKTYYASWLKINSAPVDLTTRINTVLSDARVKIFIVDSDITVNGTVSANGKVIEFESGILSGVGTIDNADIRARWSYNYLGGTVVFSNCVYSSYTPSLANDAAADARSIIYYYNTTTQRHRFKNGATWYDAITSIAQVTAQSVQGDGSAGSAIRLVNDSLTPGNSRYYGTNASGTKGFHVFPTSSNTVTTEDSLQGDGSAPNPIKLDNDNNAPGNNKVYGTDGSGIKGWRDFPAASSTINTTNSISGDGSVGTPAKLVNDTASPGNNKQYGTDGSGVRGWYDAGLVTGDSLQGDGTSGNPIKLDNDNNAPGNNQVYGTDGAGVKGWKSSLVTTGDSLQGDGTSGNPIKLDNDNNAPGNNKVYGTDGSGNKTWRDFPAASSTINTTQSITGDGSVGSPAKLVNDSLAPGNSRYYGTDAGGTKGFHSLPPITVSVTHSLDGDGSPGNPVKLDNDAASPGASKYYGTDGSGVKGFHSMPSPSSTVTTANSVSGDGSGGNPVVLVNDSNAPGASRYYGTNGGGTKGFHLLPTVDGSETKLQNGTNTTVSGTGTVGSPYSVNATIVTGQSLSGSGTSGSPATLVGDSASPGNNKLYGTNGAGSKGWYDIPFYDGSETKVNAGSNVTVTGSGTTGSPYVINATTASPVHASKSTVTAATNFSFCQVKSTSGTFEFCDKVLKVGHPSNDDQRTITLNIMLHADSTSFTLNQFNHVATVPSGFRPSGIVNFPMTSLVPGTANVSTTPVRSNSGTGILNGAVYGACGAYIDPDNGFVYARINSVSSFPTLSGVSTVVIPLNVTYFINVNT